MQNIHRIADLVPGVVIEPGETFSVNDYVGRRTTANGFVAGPDHRRERLLHRRASAAASRSSPPRCSTPPSSPASRSPSTSAHGIYISRYPYGREATLDYGNIDLEIRNNTPYGVLIWPTYGDSSITVTLYSTHYIDAEQSDQTSEPYRRVCTRVTTVRKRTYVDDRRGRASTSSTPSTRRTKASSATARS